MEDTRREEVPNLQNPVSDLPKLDISHPEVKKLKAQGRYRYSAVPPVVAYNENGANLKKRETTILEMGRVLPIKLKIGRAEAKSAKKS